MSAGASNVHRSIAPGFPGDEPLRRVGRFEIITRIGAGGMAHVYLARSQGAAGFERLAAIKVLHRHLSSDEQFVRMFFDEARVAAQIHHPNVVPILDLGTERDQLYMVMDYVAGDTLAAVQRTGIELQRALPIGIVLRVVLDALAGLDNAHELRGPDGDPLGVVHRDVSPQNILVGVDGIARLVDFGIARAERRLALTLVGTLKGKAPFMAPEQLEGRPVDRRADIFSMGVTLWEALTLRRLFPARNDLEVVSRSRRESYRSPRSLAPQLPPEVDAICAKALATDPAERFATAGDFAEAIETELRAHIASYRQVAGFMSAVAAEKVARERSALRAASVAPPSVLLDAEGGRTSSFAPPAGPRVASHTPPARRAFELPDHEATTVVSPATASVAPSEMESRPTVRVRAPEPGDAVGEGATGTALPRPAAARSRAPRRRVPTEIGAPIPGSLQRPTLAEGDSVRPRPDELRAPADGWSRLPRMPSETLLPEPGDLVSPRRAGSDPAGLGDPPALRALPEGISAVRRVGSETTGEDPLAHAPEPPSDLGPTEVNGIEAPTLPAVLPPAADLTLAPGDEVPAEARVGFRYTTGFTAPPPTSLSHVLQQGAWVLAAFAVAGVLWFSLR